MAPALSVVRRALLAWFRHDARDLPWRRSPHPYRVWLSEIMLQQTRVETVVPYYRRFLQAFPSVRKLAAADIDQVLKRWEGLGYYGRARNLHRAAHAIVHDRAGRFPRTANEWRELPGIGRYTAGAIASIAFGERTPVVDGNVKRVFARLFGIQESIDEAATVAAIWKLATDLVPPQSPGDFNQAVMELGARICTPRQPRCDGCPLRNECVARAEGRPAELPVRRKKKPVPHYDIVAAAIHKKGRYLIGQRPPSGMLGGLWEFPGGKIEDGESHEEALLREVREEVGLHVAIEERVATIHHAYSHFAISLHLYRCRHEAGRVRRAYHTRTKWVQQSEFHRYAFPAANYKCLHLLLNDS